MTKTPVAVESSYSMDEVLDVLVDHRVSIVPVLEKHGRCVGVLSITALLDLARRYVDDNHDLGRFATVHHAALIEQLRKPELTSRPVQELMAAPVLSVSPTATLREAAELMVQNHVHHLIVLDQHRKVIGVLSAMDVLRGFLEPKAASSA